MKQTVSLKRRSDSRSDAEPAPSGGRRALERENHGNRSGDTKPKSFERSESTRGEDSGSASENADHETSLNSEGSEYPSFSGATGGAEKSSAVKNYCSSSIG